MRQYCGMDAQLFVGKSRVYRDRGFGAPSPAAGGRGGLAELAIEQLIEEPGGIGGGRQRRRIDRRQERLQGGVFISLIVRRGVSGGGGRPLRDRRQPEQRRQGVAGER